MSVRCPDCGAIAGYGQEIGHRSDCPSLRRAASIGKRVDDIIRNAGAVPPVDREQRTLTDGTPVTADHRELKANGQQKGYVVLSDAERARGFVRPVRHTYIHQKCGVATTMGTALAETYARDPEFYSGTFCCGCRAHFPVGADGEFVWDDGSKVGT
ncbi:MAG TPA: hypothetical protein VF499_02935 [Afipia sp.]